MPAGDWLGMLYHEHGPRGRRIKIVVPDYMALVRSAFHQCRDAGHGKEEIDKPFKFDEISGVWVSADSEALIFADFGNFLAMFKPGDDPREVVRQIRDEEFVASIDWEACYKAVAELRGGVTRKVP